MCDGGLLAHMRVAVLRGAASVYGEGVDCSEAAHGRFNAATQ